MTRFVITDERNNTSIGFQLVYDDVGAVTKAILLVSDSPNVAFTEYPFNPRILEHLFVNLDVLLTGMSDDDDEDDDDEGPGQPMLFPPPGMRPPDDQGRPHYHFDKFQTRDVE